MELNTCCKLWFADPYNFAEWCFIVNVWSVKGLRHQKTRDWDLTWVCKGKIKWGTGYNLIPSALDRDQWEFYLMFLSPKTDIELCQMNTKIHIHTLLYRNSRLKQIVFSKYATSLKTKISQRNLIVT